MVDPRFDQQQRAFRQEGQGQADSSFPFLDPFPVRGFHIVRNGCLLRGGSQIWDGNGSREFLDKRGHYFRAEGDLGPVYGFQWRHFGAAYIDCVSDYSGKGVDQLKQVIQTIQNNPNDRRIIMSAWNVRLLSTARLKSDPCQAFLIISAI